MSNKSVSSSEILLMSRDRVDRSINRMAYQIAEENRGESDILLIGIKERGNVVARLLKKRLTAMTEKQVDVRQFLINREQQDFLKDLAVEPGYTVLVDDVIFSGQTMFRALQEVLKVLETNIIIRTAVLVDRGHRSLPVEASFVGLALPTKLNEHVHVETEPDLVKKVVLNNSSD